MNKIFNWFNAVFFIVLVVVIVQFCSTTSPTLQHSRPKISDVISLSTRGSIFGSASGVLQVRSSKVINIMALVTNTENQQQKGFWMNFNQPGMQEFGWTDGWDFKPDEEIIVIADGYNPEAWLTTKMHDGGVGIRKK